MNNFQKTQNSAIRVCLRLPSYIRTSLLHEYASIEPVQERLCTLSTKLVARMTTHNEHISELVMNYDPANNNRHVSPLDILLR